MKGTRMRYFPNDLRVMVDHIYRVCTSSDPQMQDLASTPKGNRVWELLVEKQRHMHSPGRNGHTASSMICKYRRWLQYNMHTVPGVSAERVLYIYQYYGTELPLKSRKEIKANFPNYHITYNCMRQIDSFKRIRIRKLDDDDEEEEEEREKEKKKKNEVKRRRKVIESSDEEEEEEEEVSRSASKEKKSDEDEDMEEARASDIDDTHASPSIHRDASLIEHVTSIDSVVSGAAAAVESPPRKRAKLQEKGSSTASLQQQKEELFLLGQAAARQRADIAATRKKYLEMLQEQQKGKQPCEFQHFRDKFFPMNDSNIDPSLCLESSYYEEEGERPAAAAAGAARAAATAAATGEDTTPPSGSQRPARKVHLFSDDDAVTEDPKTANLAANEDDVAVTKKPKATSSKNQAAETLQQLKHLLQDFSQGTEEMAREVSRLLGTPHVEWRTAAIVRRLRVLPKVEKTEEADVDREAMQPEPSPAADDGDVGENHMMDQPSIFA